MTHLQPRPESAVPGDPLGESELRMRLLIESIRDYAIFMLDCDGFIASWNPGAERIKGYTADEIIGRHFSVFYPDAEVAAHRCDEELRLARETGRFEEEAWRVRKDGTQFWANVVLSAVRDERGALIGFAKVTRDLTDRKRAETERAALAAAEQANRAKDEFLAILGHELRNPLAPIVTALQVMKLRGDQGSKELMVIERQVQHMQRLVNDLLDISRITQGKVELKLRPCGLAEVVASAIEIASPLIEEHQHHLTVDVSTDGLRVQADVVRLSQAISNLLTNAAKYTPTGGHIHVSAREHQGRALLEIKDDGIGVDADLLPRIFELFVQGARTSDRASGGLGVGLTLVKSLVAMHGGTVSCTSPGRGQGSTFTIALPVFSVAPADKVQQDAPLQRQAIQRRRILVVDDNEDAAALLAELFELLGHEVKTAYDGPQALATLESFTPDLAVLDIGLPVMDGYELARCIRGRLAERCQLVALTGYGQPEDRQRCMDAGFDEHLLKPISAAKIQQLLRPRS